MKIYQKSYEKLNSWMNDEISLLEEDNKKKSQDPRMGTKLLFLILLVGLLAYCDCVAANVLVECPCCQQVIEIESPQARKIPISGDLWRCSHCNNTQVNKELACVFCGNRIDRD